MKVGDNVQSQALLDEEHDLYPFDLALKDELYPETINQSSIIIDLIQREGVVVDIYKSPTGVLSAHVMWRDGSLQWVNSELLKVIELVTNRDKNDVDMRNDF